MPDELTNEEEIEEDLAVSFAAEQNLYQIKKELTEIEKEGKSFGHPSYLKYGILFTLAGTIDLVDLLDFTGVGIIVSKVVSFFLSAIIMLIFWLTNTKMKNAQNFAEGLEKRALHLQKSVVYASQLAMKTSRILGKFGAKKAARAIPRAMVKIRRIARKNPIFKPLIGACINLIPFLAVLNLMVFWIYISYRDEKKTYQGAQESAEEAVSQIELPRAT